MSISVHNISRHMPVYLSNGNINFDHLVKVVCTYLPTHPHSFPLQRVHNNSSFVFFSSHIGWLSHYLLRPKPKMNQKDHSDLLCGQHIIEIKEWK